MKEFYLVYGWFMVNLGVGIILVAFNVSKLISVAIVSVIGCSMGLLLVKKLTTKK